MTLPIIIFILAASGALSDRLIGKGGDEAHNKTKGVLVMLLACGLVGWLQAAWPIVGAGFVWCVVRRNLPFKGPWGRTTIRSGAEALGTALRWSLPAAAAAVWAINTHGDYRLIAALLAFAAVAVILALIHGELTKPGTPPLSYDPNAYAEILRGAAFGAAIALGAG